MNYMPNLFIMSKLIAIYEITKKYPNLNEKFCTPKFKWFNPDNKNNMLTPIHETAQQNIKDDSTQKVIQTRGTKRLAIEMGGIDNHAK